MRLFIYFGLEMRACLKKDLKISRGWALGRAWCLGYRGPKLQLPVIKRKTISRVGPIGFLNTFFFLGPLCTRFRVL